MKLKTVSAVNDFLDVVDKCERGVYLVDSVGNQFNLKSLFSRYISMGRLLSENGDNLELFCDSKDDEKLFFKFFNDNPEVV